jgi:hypothetical protein
MLKSRIIRHLPNQSYSERPDKLCDMAHRNCYTHALGIPPQIPVVYPNPGFLRLNWYKSLFSLNRSCPKSLDKFVTQVKKDGLVETDDEGIERIGLWHCSESEIFKYSNYHARRYHKNGSITEVFSAEGIPADVAHHEPQFEKIHLTPQGYDEFIYDFVGFVAIPQEGIDVTIIV